MRLRSFRSEEAQFCPAFSRLQVLFACPLFTVEAVKQVAAPILGATKLAHLDDAIEAVEKQLSDEEIALLEAPYQPHPVKGIQPSRRLRRG